MAQPDKLQRCEQRIPALRSPLAAVLQGCQGGRSLFCLPQGPLVWTCTLKGWKQRKERMLKHETAI